MSYKEGLDENLIVVRPYFFTEVFTESIKNVDMTKIKKKSSREIQNWTVTLVYILQLIGLFYFKHTKEHKFSLYK